MNMEILEPVYYNYCFNLCRIREDMKRGDGNMDPGTIFTDTEVWTNGTGKMCLRGQYGKDRLLDAF